MSNVLRQHAARKDPLRASCTQIARVPAQVGPGQPAIKESRACGLPGHAMRHLARGAHAQPVCDAGRRDSRAPKQPPVAGGDHSIEPTRWGRLVTVRPRLTLHP